MRKKKINSTSKTNNTACAFLCSLIKFDFTSSLVHAINKDSRLSFILAGMKIWMQN